MATLFDLSTEQARRRVYRQALWVDDGWVREFGLSNFHAVSAQAYRSGQPSPRHLRARIPRYGIRTVINLRGADPANPMLALEEDLCARMGVEIHHLRLYSRDMPDPALLHEIHALLQKIAYPVWFHCKSGADRAGLFAALYLHWMQGVPLAQTRQLRLWPFFHYRWAKTGLLDHFIDAYTQATADGPKDLLTWVDTAYDPVALKAGFRYQRVSDGLVRGLLRRE